MGQILSIPFFIPAAASVDVSKLPKWKRRRIKKRAKSRNSILTSIWNLFGRCPTVKVIGQEAKKTNEGVEAEQEEVIVQQTKENNDEKTTSTNERLEAEQEGMESEQEKVAEFYAENHNHIVCEHGRDKYTSVISFIAGKDKFKSVAVPGKKAQIKVTKEVVRRLLIGIFVRFRLLHSEGKTLSGCFTADNICVPIFKKDEDIFMAPYIEVKLDFLHPDSIKPYTDEDGDKDLMKVGWMLENDIFSLETELPSDLKKLFELLRNGPIKNKNLIYSHVSLMSPRDQVSFYLWLYKRLMYLKKRVPSNYKNIIQKLKITEGWRSKAKENKFLAKLKPSGRYSKDGKGLSRFYRNSVEHLFKLIEDCKRSSAPLVEEEELEDYHIVYILTEAFPDFLADLQNAFHEEGELETFNGEDST
ncbi:unnamed protein product [Urochloa humidicola]